LETFYYKFIDESLLQESKMKKLLAIAVVAAMTAPAMADTSVYGKAHVSVNKTSGVSGLSVESHSSRVGLKGSNALDNGLTATHKLEFGVDITDGGGLSSRDTWVGLKGGFGEVRVGRQTTPYSVIDDAVAYPQRNDHALHTFDRTNNAIAYIGKFGPVGVAAAYVPTGEAEGGPVGNSDEVTNLIANYKAGPLYAGVGFQGMPAGSNGTKIVLGYNAANYGVGLVSEKLPGSGDKVNTLSGKYSFGKASIVAQYGKNKDNALGDLAQKNIEIGYKLGKGTMAYYEWEDLDMNNAANTAVVNEKTNRVGLVHTF